MKYRKIALKNQAQKAPFFTKDNLLNELLYQKGIVEEEKIEKYLNPSRDDFISPYSFCDMKKAKDRIFEAIEKEQTILIWGDFDCDGVTSSAILYKALTKLNAKVITFIPDRLLHGHGLNSKELIKFISKEKVKLVVTVDCATSNLSQINLLNGLKVDIIITDHHSIDTELPSAFAIVNPQVESAINEDVSASDIESLTYNSGSVIAYKLAMVLLEDVVDDDLKDELLLIASCGAIADVVPLVGENRSIVSLGLEILNNKKENSHSGIYSLISKNSTSEKITSFDIAFILAPRINAVGRLANAKLSFEFLTTNDKIKQEMIIEQLDNYNKIRQAKCSEVYDEIINHIKNNPSEKDNSAIILINPNWHIGIIGIVASKIVEEFNKPCFLMTIDDNNNARCSIRSNDVINVYHVLKENQDLFLGFGGHKLAGGCSFDLNNVSFEAVKERILKTVKELISHDDEENVLYVDLELKPEEIDLGIVDTLDKLEPFGQSNDVPVFGMFNVNLDEFKLIGKEQNHLRMIVSKDDFKFQCVKWNENELHIPFNSKCDIAFYPRLNEFNGVKSIQFEIVDVYSDEISKQFKNEFKIYDHRKKDGILDQICQYLKKEGKNIAIWAKNPKTKEKLSKYLEIKENFVDENIIKNGLMFFDYPSNDDEFREILSKFHPLKIHFMNSFINENIEEYIKQIFGMVKYCSNKMEGKFEMRRLAQAITLSENFIQLALEILEEIGSIQIIDLNQVKYIKPFVYDDFKNNPTFEILKDEFEKNIQYKKYFLECDIKEIESTVEKIMGR